MRAEPDSGLQEGIKLPEGGLILLEEGPEGIGDGYGCRHIYRGGEEILES